MNHLFYDEILPLISSKREGDYWDFKETHHSNKADLLHDIICMANSLNDRNCYIIYGVENGTGNIVGVENDPNRRNQQNLIDFLRCKEFAGHCRPTIELHSFEYMEHAVDVLIVFNSSHTPFYLMKKYEDRDEQKARIVRADAIYTRIGDTNTPINQSADVANTEYLWKKRFGLHLTPFERFCILIQDKSQWDQSEDTHYHKLFSEFTITFGSNENDDYNYERGLPEFYSYVMMNEVTSYDDIRANYYGTRLFSFPTVCLDSGRYNTVVPDWGTFAVDRYHQEIFRYKYFIKGAEDYLLHRYLLDENSSEALFAMERFLEVVLVFESHEEYASFANHIDSRVCEIKSYIKDETKEQIGRVRGEEEPSKSKTAEELATGIVLKKMLANYRLAIGNGGNL